MTDGPSDRRRTWMDKDGPVEYEDAGRGLYRPPPPDLAVPPIADVLSVQSDCFCAMTRLQKAG